MNIRLLAFDTVKAAEIFIERAERFFYSVMLLSYRCPKCNGSLRMAAEGRCKRILGDQIRRRSPI
jgi:uncharacterized protein with PIN domain